MKTFRMFIEDKRASPDPLIAFLATIIGGGALYTFMFIILGGPLFQPFASDNIYTTFIVYIINYIPLIVLIVAGLGLIKAGTRQSGNENGGRY